MPKARRLDVLFRGVLERILEPELPDSRLNLGVPLRGWWPWPYDELCRELAGLDGEMLLCLKRGVFLPSEDAVLAMFTADG